MVDPPDSKNPPTPSTAGEQRGIEPEVDSLSTLVPEQVPLEWRDSLPPQALTEAQTPGADTTSPDVDIIWPWADDADQSWWSRLRSLKAAWETKHRRPSAHDEPVTTEADRLEPAARTGDVATEAIGNLEEHLASLAALRDVCASIDRRLARVEEVSGQRHRATIDEALHDVCSQMSNRLVRVEAAVERTEGFVAQKPWDLSTSAHTRLEHVEETLRLTQQALADRTLHELCRNIETRLERTEDTLHRREGIVAESLQQLSARMTARFAEVEETLRRTQKSLADSMPPDMGVNIERQLAQARTVLQRAEEAAADKTLHELCQNIEARLERTEETLHRSEGFVAEWLQDFSARTTARLATVEETIQRIERVVSRGTVEQQPSVRMDDRLVHTAETAYRRVLASAVLFLNRFAKIRQTNRPIQLPWMAGLAVPVLVVVAVLAIGDLIRTSRGVEPEKVGPATTTDQISAPVVPATNEGIGATSTTAVMANAPRSSTGSVVSAPQQRSPDRESAPTTARRSKFVGTLSITSVPSGASVSLNGKPAGKTPLRLPRQPAGSLAVQIRHDGFERWSAAVLVPADQLTQVTANLRASAR